MRSVIPGHGRLLIVEPVLPDTVDGSAPAVMYLSDLNMLVNLGGRERTRTDFDELYNRAGFALTTVTPLPPRRPSASSRRHPSDHFHCRLLRPHRPPA